MADIRLSAIKLICHSTEFYIKIGMSTSEIIGRCQSLMCCRKKDGTITVETPSKQVKEYYKIFGCNVPAHVKEESFRKELGLKM